MVAQKIEVKGTAQPEISLNGSWKFSMAPPEKHWENGVEFGDWADILVPGECQMQGFPIQHNIPYVYKTSFRIPGDYKDKQVFIDFYGVYSQTRVWVNGIFVREHFGGFTRWTCPLPEEVKAGEEAVLTVEIMDRSDDISYGSGYAKHQIGGILRKVELRALPDQHFKKIYLETELDEQYRDANLNIEYELSLDGPVEVRFELKDEDGKAVVFQQQEIMDREGQIRIPVKNPRKWDAEHPVLYTLVTSLVENDTISLVQKERIGFRDVHVDGNLLLVNGRPVKLRGACRHDIHPMLGRMTTPEYDLKDVILAKESNMNFIRTSHYPPSEEFLDYCDQYGIYVEDETAVCFVGSHRTDQYKASGASQENPEFTDRYLSQLDEMLHHHRNHPSVIIWSIGNENVFGTNFTRSYQHLKNQDDSRPVIYSYPGQVPDSLQIYEILSMHYPDWQGNLNQYKIQTRGFAYEGMPVLFDEWAHVSCYNNFELKEDPNVRNFWGQSLDSMWSKTFEADGGLGGAIWCMLDETFMLPEDLPGFNQWWGILDENIIPAAYMGPCVGYGEWGIVDTWRRKKPEFWATKKAYSPTRLLVKTITSFSPGSELNIPVYNRFDHTNLNELKIIWKYAGQSGEVMAPELDPHKKGSLIIPAKEWKKGEELHLSFYQHDTLMVDSYTLPMGKLEAVLPACKPGELEVLEETEKIILTGGNFSMEINRKSGLMEHIIREGDTLIKSGPYLNLRVPGDAIQYSTLMMDNLAAKWSCSKTSFRLEKGIAIVETEGSYDNSMASFVLRIDAGGILEISYIADSFLNKDSIRRNIQEAGLRFICGSSFTELNWESDPYFTSYPGSHPGRSKGRADFLNIPDMFYRSQPSHGWEKDSRGFYYFGLEEKLPYTNEVRSLKSNIYSYALFTDKGTGLKVYSSGNQAGRFDRIGGQNTLIINDQWDYNSLKWGNYYKAIPLPEKLDGKVILSISSLDQH